MANEIQIPMRPGSHAPAARWHQYFKQLSAAEDRAANRERHQRDMGFGYLVYIARRFANLTQAELAEKIRKSRSAISRWERARRMPTLTDLELMAQVTGLELVIGLRKEGAADEDGFLALAVVQEEGLMTELEMLVDPFASDWIAPTVWRREVETQMKQIHERFAAGKRRDRVG